MGLLLRACHHDLECSFNHLSTTSAVLSTQGGHKSQDDGHIALKGCYSRWI